MNDPRRLMSGGADDFERSLLDAASDDGPSPARRARVAALLGVTSVTTTAVASGAGAAGLLKWIGRAALAAVVAGTGALALRSSGDRVLSGAQPSRPAATAMAQASAPSVPAVELAVVPQAATVEPPAPRASIPSVAAAPQRPSARASAANVLAAPAPAASSAASPLVAPDPAPSAATATLADETRVLNEALAALRAGQPAAAIARLDAYASRFPRGTLSPEALAIRIEALEAAGDRSQAALLAQRFLASQPNHPMARHFRDLIDQAAPANP